jgi:hypothetical protein
MENDFSLSSHIENNTGNYEIFALTGSYFVILFYIEQPGLPV